MLDSLSLLSQVFIILVIWAWVCVGNVIYFVIRWFWFNRFQNKAPKDKGDQQVVVIEAVKGVEKEFHAHVLSLMAQAYPCYRLIFCLSDAKDPAFGFLTDFFGLDSLPRVYHLDREDIQDLHQVNPGLISIDIVLAGQARTCSQKICNQIAAYGCLTPQDKLLAWVDADVCLTDSWLADLVYPIQNKTLAAVTGYRCLVPEGQDWVSAFISVINSSILTLFGDPWRNSFWGGSMAMTRQVFDKFQIPVYVKQCFSDDESVAALLKKNNIPIYFSYAVLPPSTIKYTFREMFNFGRRQYMCARFYYKFHVFIAVVLLGGFTMAFLILTAKLFFWQTGSDILLFFGLTSAMGVRGIFRFSFIRYTLKIQGYGFKCFLLETLGTPLIHLLHLCICFSAMVGNTVDWAGITYKIKDPFNVKVL
ncbi:MAG: hypothetical protein HOJ48_18230 [Desulfobacula sp.]|nr:hypothetical protein [Desulfobacula sp.]